jgi:gliding motility-associated-like protein
LQPIKDIPNVFTPNGDGINDTWIFNLGFGNTFNTLSIFNRWGIEILNDKLEMENVITWSGRTSSGIECSAGVYFYALEYLDNKGDKQKKNGYVSLFR